MDIGSTASWPSSDLSNFAPHEFMFDGVLCASMEGLLQSFKFEDMSEQLEICGLVGKTAKKRGQSRNQAWKLVQRLWWRGQAFDRHGPEYQAVLDRAFEALTGNEDFRVALLATSNAQLTHVIGSNNPAETILTEDEFCLRLMRLREAIQ